MESNKALKEAALEIKEKCKRGKIISLIASFPDVYMYTDELISPFKRYSIEYKNKISKNKIGLYELIKEIESQGLYVYYGGTSEWYYISFDENLSYKKIVLN